MKSDEKKSVSESDLFQGLTNKLNYIMSSAGTISASLDGVKNQVRPILEDIQVAYQGMEQLKVMLETKVTNLLTEKKKLDEENKKLKEELDMLKMKLAAYDLKEKGKNPAEAMKKPKQEEKPEQKK